ncbi:peroxisomal succinyl-coenzyme A thioesterase-like isoform X1 [Sander lucioperca]|uniref:peroxisomal succinyl-coenzyme A thioesterase-like isoform X1 n=3 Tax=Sander lucioperca TaxID=283035 RepID=UPI001653B139|nr:peroxisomal succinyl-coenzyme A thioesterase-like isoform X1 [Sander lucioperca]XP_031169133.2 peroxisomal succinyl-coenzyme A thioesterase-like isoform X1 [Sander lucioperca]XP_031169134.2 peroxisomal succinyl-coenzyme A thioesterase-like isoform X1 [Sander lucioperca]XP_031169135.2 peroxisomal succinyl-coenzyme A thioesterase-like isoform X1 [Sander lucioperca]XP_035852229.1 peroxisomal succinyl-coenzyme A thioesterase-like isoform X1 [Sander lucioperca]
MSDTVAPMLSVFPSRALVDENFKVVVENLPPGSPVTLHSLHQCEDKHYWEAYGHYISNHRGTVSVTDDLSFGGTYTGKEAMGLLWSMRPVPGSREGLRLRKRNVCSPLLVNISVYRGHVVEGFREQAPLASSLTERWYMAPGLQRIEIREKGVRGTLFLPPGPGPFPGLLDIWGGGGGLVEYRSALLGSHGYASLALEYFAPGELKSSDLEFNYFETAFNIVKDHPQVMPDKVGIFGLSLGAILTLLLAAESSIIKPSCCVCVSGNHLYPRGGSIKEALNMRSPKIRLDENNYEIWRDMGLPIPDDLADKIDVGRINCPVMVVNSHDDQNWATVESSEDMAQMMRAAGNLHLLTRLYYPDAGHLIEPPYTPHFRATKFVKDKKEKVILLWGGQTKPHSDAQEDSWKKILAFLEQNLYSSPTLKAKM